MIQITWYIGSVHDLLESLAGLLIDQRMKAFNAYLGVWTLRIGQPI